MVSLQLDLFNSTVFSSHQDWLTWLHHHLPQPQPQSNGPLVFDLFAGCGGLALGFEIAGFQTVGFEMKPQAVETYNHNLAGHCEQVMLDIGSPVGQPAVIVGGPPCQPFSQIGYQRGRRDPRDGVPIFLDAVNRLQPQIAIFENVRGLLFRNKDYLRKAIAELEQFGYQVEARLFDLLPRLENGGFKAQAATAGKARLTSPNPMAEAPAIMTEYLSITAESIQPFAYIPRLENGGFTHHAS